jgi:hypothetical protein
VVLDSDAEGALKLARELRAKIQQERLRCDPTSLRAGGAVESAVKKVRE